MGESSRWLELSSGELLLKAVLEKGPNSVVAADERRVRRMSRALMCQLRYDDVEMVRTLNVNTADLYEIRCLSASAAGGVVTWYVIALAPVKQPELHCFGHAEACSTFWRKEIADFNGNT